MSILDIFKVKEYEEKIFQLEVENESLKQDLKTQKSQFEFSIRKLNRDLTQRNSTIKSVLPLFDAERINLAGSFENFQLLWMKWGTDIHRSDPQVLRQERACSDILTSRP